MAKAHWEKGASQPKRLGDDRLLQSAGRSAGRNLSCSSQSVSPSSHHLSVKSPSSRLSTLVRYFIMKSSNLCNIDLSQQRGIWSTTPSNELKLNRAFVDSSVVFLIFSVQGSGQFQGYARMSSAIGLERCQDWGSAGLGGVFRVEWVRKDSLPFQLAQQLVNPWNDNKKVQISRDGQELEPQVGDQLLQLWEKI